MASLWPATLLIAVCLASAADVPLEDDVRNGSSPAVPILRRLKRVVCREMEGHWHVEGIRETISNGFSFGKANSYSDTFLLNAYNVSLDLKVSRSDGELWLGLFLGICKGIDDEFQTWPFRTPYTLTIFHPTNKTLDISKTISSFSTATLASFKRPTTGCNVYWGFSELIRVSEVEKQGYIVDNAVSVGVKLNP
ncbi:uncharacterized protein LOC135366241 [Ornithodoros turicata]|uniref:uncharacterized protein LOC135366241 n=1 Tax=Ornithodoros turicata TaxID=34597 RepID=UPI0031394462